MKKIIAFIGFEGSGKDFATSEVLKSTENSSRIGFSDGVRRATFKFCNCSPKYGEEYEQWKKDIIPELGKTGREMLLYIGEGRRSKNPYVWGEEWFFTASWSSSSTIVVNDCRFIHEANTIISLANAFNAEYEFIYCAYKSRRFRYSFDDCDELSRVLYNAGLEHKDNVTEIIKNYVDEFCS